MTSARPAGVKFMRGLLVVMLVAAIGAAAPAASGAGDTCDGLAATITGTTGDDVLRGTAGRDVIVGLGGLDIIRGGGGSDVICGGAGNDRLFGGNGDDRVFGEGGDDLVLGQRGDDTLDGGGGTDKAWYATSPNPVVVDLATGTASGDGTDALSGFEYLVGSRFGDVLRGDDGNNVLWGLAGDDTLGGGPGKDLLRAAGGDDALDGGPGRDRLRGHTGTDTCRNGPVMTGCELVPDLQITAVNFDAAGDDNQNENGEWVEITNQGNGAADLTGWRIEDEGPDHTYFFTDAFELAPGARVTLHSGTGADTPTTLYWGESNAVWNNPGDTASLFDSAGLLIDAQS